MNPDRALRAMELMLHCERQHAGKKRPSIRARARLPTTREKPAALTRACVREVEVRRVSHSGSNKTI